MKSSTLYSILKSMISYGVLLSLLTVAACAKKKRNSDDNAENNPGTPAPEYIIEELADDDDECLTYNGVGKGIRSNDFPDFNGPVRVFFIEDEKAVVSWHFVDAKAAYGPFAYVLYMLTEEGTWEKIFSNSHYDMDTISTRYSRQVTGLHPDTWYTFRMALVTSPISPKYAEVCSNKYIVRFKTKAHPRSPTMVYIKDGNHTYAYKIGNGENVKIVVRAGGPSVRVYDDSACTHLVGETSTTEGNFYVLNLEDPLEDGEHTFYATTVNSYGTESPCSTANATYSVINCPEGYVAVSNYTLGVSPFCLMATEARRGANDMAVPGYAEYPWETTPQEAKNACRRIGPNCDLVTNLEWMAAARLIEEQDTTYHSGHVLSNLGVLNISNPNDEYDQLGTTNARYRRTFKISSGTLWDFGGNLAEWADNAEVGGEIFQPITNTCPRGPFELKDENFYCPELDVRYYTPYSKSGHSSYYVGRIVGPEPYDQYGAVPLAAARGGQHDDLNNSGIYSLFMFNHLDDTNGFRCACHLPE